MTSPVAEALTEGHDACLLPLAIFLFVLFSLPKRTKKLVATKLFLENYAQGHRAAKAQTDLYCDATRF